VVVVVVVMAVEGVVMVAVMTVELVSGLGKR
jgi:hypothetical protein